jgi:membrane associated rhomboid family serine protease
MSNDSDISLRVTDDYKLAEEWELVLLAQGLSPGLRPDRNGVVLTVPQDEIESARAALLAYERENPTNLADRSEPLSSASSLAGSALAGILILVFFSVTIVSNPAMSWFERGSADARQILHGELWRTATALTLHADVAHAVSNAIAVALFLGALSNVLGMGLGCALILLAGAGGNLANAFLHGSPHVSVGASTSVFGAVGALCGLGVVIRRRKAVGRRRAWLPIAAALALLGMLGTGGDRVDVWAHLLGLLVGCALGVVIALIAPHPPGSRFQWACGGAAVSVLIYCWLLALR